MSFLAKVIKPKPGHLTSTLALFLLQNNTHLKAVITRAHYFQLILKPTMLQY